MDVYGNKGSAFNVFCHHDQGAKGPAANEGSEQQQGARSVAPMNQSIQRKVTVTVQQQQAAGRALQANQGAMGHPQQNRVRHKWGLRHRRSRYRYNGKIKLKPL